MINHKSYQMALVERGLRQWQLALKLGISPEYLSKIIKGWHPITPKIKAKMCRVLKVKEKEIFIEKKRSRSK